MENFIRLTESSAGKPLSLDTSIVSYRAEKGSCQVDLISAIHVGEESYYQQLNGLFDRYDVLLYELVAPEGAKVAEHRDRGSGNPVSWMQDAMKSFLGLESQLAKIDYGKKHFVRADLSPAQISEKMRERGESAITLVLSALVEVIRQQNLAGTSPQKSSLAAMDLSLTELLQNPHQAKLLFAQQLVSAGSLDQMFGGSLNQLLVLDRNTEALRGLQKQLARGHQRIGIFYGAAHMPDFEQRLVQDFGLKKEGTSWVKAWDLTTTKGRPMDGLSLMLNLLDEIADLPKTSN
jgi:hypothetical protein